MSPDQTPGVGNPRTSASAGEFENLLRELRDFNDSVREKAASRLGEIGNKEAIQPLIGRLNNDKSPQVQWSAADALYRIGDTQVWPAIRSRLGAGGDKKVRAKCAEVLGLSGYKLFADDLVDALEQGGEIAKQAAIGLGRLKNLDVLDKLIKTIDTNDRYDEYQGLKINCTIALTEIGPDVIKKVLETAGNHLGDSYRISTLVRLGQPAVTQIATYLNNSKPAIRSVAVQALVKINSDDSTRHLCNIAKSEKDSFIRAFALNEMEHRSTKQVEDALIYVLRNDPDENLKEKAAEIIGELEIIAGLEHLCTIASRKYISTASKQAIISLGLLGDPRAIPTLGSLLLDCSDGEARRLAAEAIAEIESSAGFEYLLSALGSDGNTNVRQASAIALGQLRDRRAIDPLKQVSTSDPDNSVREAAKSALKMF